MQLQCSILDTSNPAATPQQILQKMGTLLGSGSPEEDEQAEEEEAELDQEEQEPTGEAETPQEAAEKQKRRKLRLAKIRRKVKERGYEFTNGSSTIAGVLFVEMQKVLDLPPERNGEDVQRLPTAIRGANRP